jgi:homocysteine S-methyltransferase
VAAGVDQVVAVGVNCCDPRDVLPAVREAVAVTGKPAVAYPNSGERWNAAARRWDAPATFVPAMAAEWRRAGALLVGGCCRVGPEAVAGIRRELLRRGRGAEKTSRQGGEGQEYSAGCS